MYAFRRFSCPNFFQPSTNRRGPSAFPPTMPAADSRSTVRMDHSILSRDSATCSGSPEVSSTAFRAQQPDLPPVCLVDPGFAVLCQLAPHRRPLHPVLVHRLASLIHASFRPRLTTTPLRFSSPSPSTRLGRGLSPPSCRTCSAHKEKDGRFLARLCPQLS